jgi:hypothetical protein
MSKSQQHLVLAVIVGAVAIHMYHTKMKPKGK